jgi:predicted dehydrogenase/threonine dehydrogenase-like Zn-dependent dehydrogenase
MRQVIRRGLRDMIVDEVPDPPLSSHHVLVQPIYSLISSGTETASIHTGSLLREVAEQPSHIRRVLEVMRQQGPLRTLREVNAKRSEYSVLGYSGAGIVARTHPTVRDLPPGSRVAYGGEGTGHGECVVTGRHLVAEVPDGVPLDAASFATLGAIALNAVRQAAIGLGESVAVLGLGLVGQLIAQLARLQGGRVIAIDLVPERVDLACRLGAPVGFVASEGLRDQVLAAAGGRGVDCAIVAAAAKSAGPCEDALAMTRDRGRLVVVGAVELTFPWLEMYLKEIQLNMARAYGPGSYDPGYEKQGVDYPLGYVRWTENRNMQEFLRLIGTGQVVVEELITDRFPLEWAPEAYAKIMQQPAKTLGVVLSYGRSEAEVRATPYSPKTRVEVAPERSASLAVALIGAGNIARWEHLPALGKCRDTTLRAVCSASGARAKSYARRFRAAYCTSSYEEVLADADTHAVLIVTRNQHHATQALQALQAGKHVFVEKPMALTQDACVALCRAERESGRVLAVGFNRRFAPDYRYVRDQLSRRSGPAVLHCRVNSPGLSGGLWMADPAIGGAILGEGCHFVDLFHWLLEAEFTTVSAYSFPASDTEPIGINNITACFRMSDGSIANLSYCTTGSPKGGGERLEAFAPGITLRTEDFKGHVRAGRPGHRRRRWFADKGYAAQMEAFVGAIRSGTAHPVTAADGARATLACLALLDSAAAGGEPRSIDLSVLR